MFERLLRQYNYNYDGSGYDYSAGNENPECSKTNTRNDGHRQGKLIFSWNRGIDKLVKNYLPNYTADATKFNLFNFKIVIFVIFWNSFSHLESANPIPMLPDCGVTKYRQRRLNENGKNEEVKTLLERTFHLKVCITWHIWFFHRMG